jgi:pyridoxine kinase
MAIHDLSGFGRAALTVVIPILSSMGIQVCPLPTAVYSTHGLFPGHTSVDLTDFLQECLRHWTTLDLKFDAIYSGFLGSVQQLEHLSGFLQQHATDHQLVVIDPVLGDHGKLYGVTDPGMVERMQHYIRVADLITPNLTEAALLLDELYHPEIQSEQVQEWCARLAEMGPKHVIITSVPMTKLSEHIAVMVYDHTTGSSSTIDCEMLPVNYPGTGDAFTSVIVGRLLHHDPLEVAVERAVQFMAHALRLTLAQATPVKEGILLEQVLDALRI